MAKNHPKFNDQFDEILKRLDRGEDILDVEKELTAADEETKDLAEVIKKLSAYREEVNPDPALLERILAQLPEAAKPVPSPFNAGWWPRLKFNYLFPLTAAAVIMLALIFNLSGYLSQPDNPDILMKALAEEATHENVARLKENNFNSDQLRKASLDNNMASSSKLDL